MSTSTSFLNPSFSPCVYVAGRSAESVPASYPDSVPTYYILRYGWPASVLVLVSPADYTLVTILRSSQLLELVDSK
ncbi:uncharacterized protein LAJ45_09274 [Morchella importuna]|uniref:uncharacterized protein n=1 Tax=Morchella importuna TaxID=1174673 RepID=UPI001E8D1CEE|nr:uncharacterized protein LAJ45_09274 [Morchella importuna]KAH8146592.1 hypothetical protein LAJ45_09274 [Morchella importuna]